MRLSSAIRFVGLTVALCAWTTLIRAESRKSDKDFDFYISPRGDDNWSGRLPEPNAARTDGPLATLEKAKSKVRAERLKKPAAKIRVALRGGDYRLSKNGGVLDARLGGQAREARLIRRIPARRPSFRPVFRSRAGSSSTLYPSRRPQLQRNIFGVQTYRQN